MNQQRRIEQLAQLLDSANLELRPRGDGSRTLRDAAEFAERLPIEHSATIAQWLRQAADFWDGIDEPDETINTQEIAP